MGRQSGIDELIEMLSEYRCAGKALIFSYHFVSSYRNNEHGFLPNNEMGLLFSLFLFLAHTDISRAPSMLCKTL